MYYILYGKTYTMTCIVYIYYEMYSIYMTYTMKLMLHIYYDVQSYMYTIRLIFILLDIYYNIYCKTYTMKCIIHIYYKTYTIYTIRPYTIRYILYYIIYTVRLILCDI